MATVAARRSALTKRGPSGAFLALTRRAFRDARIRTIAFAYAFAIYAYIQPAGFRRAYPTLADRIAFAHSFAGNAAVRLFYGYPYDPVTIGGYTAWRVGGTLAIAAAAFGVLAAVRALRAEEDAGRAELILAAPVARATALSSALTAIAAGILLLWLATIAGYVAGGLPVGGSAYLALATSSVAAVFVGVGAISSQLAPTRRIALELGGVLVAVALLLRVVADTAGGMAWLRWATPLGWAEEMRPFTGAQPAVLLLPIAASTASLWIAARMAHRRDLGTGVLPTRDTATPRLGLLSNPTAQALRSERGSLITWAGSFAVFGVILGMVSTSVSSAGVTPQIRREIAKLGSGSIVTPRGYVALIFMLFALAVCLFTCAQIAAARHEEAEGRLETLLALPVSRLHWLGGRIGLAAGAASILSVIAGLSTWAGASSQGVQIPLGQMLEAAANCLPVALLFLGVSVLLYAVVPRVSVGVAYGLVMAAFLWYLVGAIAGVPNWLVQLTPFAHIGLVPVHTFRVGAALVMITLGAAASGAGLAVFRRRDLTGA